MKRFKEYLNEKVGTSLSELLFMASNYDMLMIPISTSIFKRIIAMGANPNLDLANALQTRNIRSTAIGDCTSVGYIHGAIADARNAVLEMDDLA